MSPMTIPESVIPPALRSIWTSNGLPESFLQHLKLTGDPDTAAPTSFRVGLAAQISIGLAGLSAAYVHYLRTGVKQDVTVDARHAVLSFHSQAFYTINDAIPEAEAWDSIAGLYRTKDDGWVRIHTNFPHHRSGILSILSIPDTPTPATRSEVASAIQQWDAQTFEDECAKQGMCAFRLRSTAEWEETVPAKVLKGVPVVTVNKIGEAEKMVTGKGKKRPLEGVRILDMTRVLAGPVAGRTLAAQGAQVLLITSPRLPSLPSLDIETSLGKRTTQLDLTSTSKEDAGKLRELVKNADVFLQAYRPGGIQAKGFGAADVMSMRLETVRQGIVYASLRAWGWEGPWADRRGFDSLVQTATGFNVDEGEAFWQYMNAQGATVSRRPKPLPVQALDHAAGYFLAFGINIALTRMLTEGGSHEVRVSLAGVGQWIRSLGRIDPLDAFGPNAQPMPVPVWPQPDELAALSTVWLERRGTRQSQVQGRKMTALRQAANLSSTPVREGIEEDQECDWGAPMKLNADFPVWEDEF